MFILIIFSTDLINRLASSVRTSYRYVSRRVNRAFKKPTKRSPSDSSPAPSSPPPPFSVVEVVPYPPNYIPNSGIDTLSIPSDIR